MQGVIVVGDIDVDQIEAKIKKIFGPIKMPKDAAERKYFPVPDNKEPIIAIAKDKEQQVNQVYVYHKHDPFPEDLKNTVGYLIYNYMTSAVSKHAEHSSSRTYPNRNSSFYQCRSRR